MPPHSQEGGKSVQLVPMHFLAAALEAAQGPDVAMQLDDVLRTGQIVQAIDVLRDKREALRALFQSGQS